MTELAQITLNSHHIQANELAENAEDITDKPDERVKLQHGERHGESSNSVESTGGGGEGAEEGKETQGSRYGGETRERRREGRSTRPWRTSCRPPRRPK